MTITLSSSERIAWSTCQPLLRWASMYDILAVWYFKVSWALNLYNHHKRREAVFGEEMSKYKKGNNFKQTFPKCIAKILKMATKGNAGSTFYSGPPEVFMRRSRYQSRFQDPGTKHSQDRIRSILSVRKYDKIEKYWHELIVSLDIVTKATILTWKKLWNHKYSSQYPGVFITSPFHTDVSRFLNIWLGIPK